MYKINQSTNKINNQSINQSKQIINQSNNSKCTNTKTWRSVIKSTLELDT